MELSYRIPAHTAPEGTPYVKEQYLAYKTECVHNMTLHHRSRPKYTSSYSNLIVQNRGEVHSPPFSGCLGGRVHDHFTIPF